MIPTLPPPLKVIPPLLGLAARHCPFRLQKAVADTVLRQAFAEAIADGDLDFLKGRRLGMDITDIGFQATLSLVDNQPSLLRRLERPEALIRGTLSSFIQLATRKQDPDTLFFQRRLSMEGDTELGLEVKNLIDSIDITGLPRWMQQGLRMADHFDRRVLMPSG